MGGTPGAGSASPPTGEQKEGLSTRAAGQQLLRVQWVSGVLLSHPFSKPWELAQGRLRSPGAAPGWHTHHTPAQDTLHFSEGGHRGVPALVVEVPAAPEAARPRRIRLHGVSQLQGTLLWGCGKGHREDARLRQGSLWPCQWGHTGATQGERRVGEGCRYLGTACSSQRGWRARGWHR